MHQETPLSLAYALRSCRLQAIIQALLGKEELGGPKVIVSTHIVILMVETFTNSYKEKDNEKGWIPYPFVKHSLHALCARVKRHFQ